MNLMLVTFDGDLSQFLVNAKDEKEAVRKAIAANLSSVFGSYNKEEESDIKNSEYYSVEKVNDMAFLGEIIKREDYITTFNNVICFNG